MTTSQIKCANQIKRANAERLVDAILKRGFYVEVTSDGETLVERTNDAAKLKAGLWQCDEEVLVVTLKGGGWAGGYILFYDNAPDEMLHDWHYLPATKRVMDEMQAEIWS